MRYHRGGSEFEVFASRVYFGVGFCWGSAMGVRLADCEIEWDSFIITVLQRGLYSSPSCKQVYGDMRFVVQSMCGKGKERIHCTRTPLWPVQYGPASLTRVLWHGLPAVLALERDSPWSGQSTCISPPQLPRNTNPVNTPASTNTSNREPTNMARASYNPPKYKHYCEKCKQWLGRVYFWENGIRHLECHHCRVRVGVFCGSPWGAC